MIDGARSGMCRCYGLGKKRDKAGDESNLEGEDLDALLLKVSSVTVF